MSQVLRTRSPDDMQAAQTIAAESVKSLSNQAYERILDMMLSGELPVGTILQERRIAEALSISRTPTREALGRLESEGLVARQFGRILTVREFSVHEFIEILNVRKLLEMEAAGLAVNNMSAERAREARQAIKALRKTETPTVAQHWAVDDLVHGLIAESSGNRTLTGLIRDLRRRTHMFNVRRIPNRLQASCHEHLALIDAIENGDAEGARRIAATHIENVKVSIIDKLKAL